MNYSFITNILLSMLQSQLKLQLPDWANAVFPEPLSYLRSLLMSIEAQDRTVARFNAGTLPAL